MNFAPALWGIPVVQSNTDRLVQFPTPQVGQRVQNLDSSNIERWDGTQWLTDFSPSEAGVLTPEQFGAIGGGNDDTAAWVALAAAAKLSAGVTTADVAGGVVIRLRNTRYKCTQVLNFDNITGLIIEGAAGLRGTSNDSTLATLEFTQSGSGNCISIQSSIGAVLRNIRVVASNSAFTGRIVNADGLMGNDTSYFVMDNCQISGTSTATAAAYGVTLERAISSTIRNTLFSWVGYGIGGCPSGGGYSNSITVEDCLFLRMTTNAIFNADEAWLIKRCTFEQTGDGKATGYACNRQAIGPVMFLGCWFGDNSVAGQPFIAFQGQSLVCTGNMFGIPSSSADAAIQIGQAAGAIVGCAIFGNHFLGDAGGSACKITGGAFVFNFTWFSNPVDSGSGTPVGDTGGFLVDYMIVDDNGIHCSDKVFAKTGIAVGNSLAASTPGTVVKKMQVFDMSGASLGYVPIYNAIT